MKYTNKSYNNYCSMSVKQTNGDRYGQRLLNIVEIALYSSNAICTRSPPQLSGPNRSSSETVASYIRLRHGNIVTSPWLWLSTPELLLDIVMDNATRMELTAGSKLKLYRDHTGKVGYRTWR